MSEPTNSDISDRIGAVKEQLNTVAGNVGNIKEKMLTRAHFDEQISKLAGKGGKKDEKDPPKKKDDGIDWKSVISGWSDTLFTGFGKIIDNLLNGKWNDFLMAIVALFGVQLLQWNNLLKKALDKRGLEEKPDNFFKYGRKTPVATGSEPINMPDIKNMKDARLVADALSKSITRLSQELDRAAQAAAAPA